MAMSLNLLPVVYPQINKYNDLYKGVTDTRAPKCDNGFTSLWKIFLSAPPPESPGPPARPGQPPATASPPGPTHPVTARRGPKRHSATHPPNSLRPKCISFFGPFSYLFKLIPVTNF